MSDGKTPQPQNNSGTVAFGGGVFGHTFLEPQVATRIFQGSNTTLNWSKPAVLISTVDQDGISRWDHCLICGSAFGANAEIFQVSDHAHRVRHGMHVSCVASMIDQQVDTTDDQFDRYLAKVEKTAKKPGMKRPARKTPRRAPAE